jgi:hypothetical protein
MTNFSTNQVMQFYVADSFTVLPYKDEKAFKISFPTLGVTSDKIENIEWVKLTKATKLTPKMKKATVAFVGDVIVGQDYVVRVSYPEVGGAGVESWTTKTAVAHAIKGATKETVIADLKDQLTKILGVDDVLTVGDTTDGITITPNIANIKYEQGVRPIAIPDFNVAVNQVVDDGEVVNWVTLDDNQQIPVADVPTGLTNGYKLADMEYFAMGERGDEYRMAAYPNHIVTDYKIVPTQNYDVYNIHYSYKGYNTQSHKSEKDLIIAVTPGTTLPTAFTEQLTKQGVTLITIQ